MSTNKAASEAYAQFLRAIGVECEHSGIDVEDSASHAAELMESWMRGLHEDRPSLSLMNAPGNGLVSLKSLPFYSICGHHFVPFFGTIDIDYIPDQHIAGLGGFTRVIDFYARRPQFQEQLCAQIAEHLFEDLKPRSLRVRILARQMCLELHGKGAGIEIESVSSLGEAF